MASNLDVYAPCPCGSGKKVKFCCSAALPEMDRIVRLHDKGQLRPALDALAKLAEQFPNAPIISITRVQLLMEGQLFTHAADEMREFLKLHPESGNGTALLALARFMDVGFHDAKPEIHRAFQVCQQSAPDVLASLAMHLGDDFGRRNPMACREHFGLALRLTTDAEERQQLFSQLMKLDSSPEFPYPLRGTHHLERLDPVEGLEKELKNAYRLSISGCWEISAKLFQKLADKAPTNWAVWKNIGLCRAWDDNPSGAAEAFHKAAELAPDFESAVECETMAQLLELGQIEETVPVKISRYRLSSVGRALSILDQLPRVVRLQIPKEDAPNGVRTLARYFVLDIPAPADSEPVRDDNLPVVQTEITIYLVANPNRVEEGILSLFGVECAARTESTQFVETALASELVSEPPAPQHDHDHGPDCDHDHDHDAAPVLKREAVSRRVLAELMPMQHREYFGSRLSMTERRERFRRDCVKFVKETWSRTALKRLGGKTPREAAADPALRVKVAAAIHSLQGIDYGSTFFVNFDELRTEWGVQHEQPSVFNDQTINALSTMQSHRLPLKELSLEQLGHVLQRAMLVRHAPFTYAVLKETVSRGLEHLQGMTKPLFFKTIADVSRELGHTAEAAEWAKQGRLEADRGDDFRVKLECATREFEIRLEAPNDPELPAIIDRLWHYFGEKIPNLRDGLEPLLRSHNLPIPGRTASGILLPDSMLVGAGNSTAPRLILPD